MLRDISRKYYAEEFQLSPKDVDELIDEAVSTLARNIEEFQRLFTQNSDTATIKEAAHAIKGNLLNMGLDDQAEIALDIEHSAENDMAGAEKLFQTLKKQLDEF